MLDEKNVSAPSVLAGNRQNAHVHLLLYAGKREPTALESIARIVDEYVLEQIIMRMNNRHGPHLAPQKAHSFHNRICQPIERNLMWSSRVVRSVWLFSNPFVPVVSVAIKRAFSVAIDLQIISAENEGCRLVLVADREGVIEPVLDVCAPL